MIYKIHFERFGICDEFVVEGQDIEAIKKMAQKEAEVRCLDQDINNMWSEKIE